MLWATVCQVLASEFLSVLTTLLAHHVHGLAAIGRLGNNNSRERQSLMASLQKVVSAMAKYRNTSSLMGPHFSSSIPGLIVTTFHSFPVCPRSAESGQNEPSQCMSTLSTITSVVYFAHSIPPLSCLFVGSLTRLFVRGYLSLPHFTRPSFAQLCIVRFFDHPAVVPTPLYRSYWAYRCPYRTRLFCSQYR